TGGAYTGQLVPLVPVRWRMKHNGIIYNRWRGFAMQWNVEAPGKVGDTYTDVRAVDALTIMQLYDLGAPFVDEVIADSPTLWYRFSEPAAASAAQDSSGNKHTGVYSGSPTLGTDGGPIQAETDFYATFDGTDDSVQMPSGALFSSDPLSLEIWFRTSYDASAAGQLQTIWSQRADTGDLTKDIPRGMLEFTHATDEKFRFVGYSGSTIYQVVSDADVFNDGEWHQALFTADAAGNLKVYWDGVAGDTDTQNLVFDRTTIEMYAGRSTASLDSAFTGDLSEVIHYDTELSPARVTAHYEAGIGWLNQLTSVRVTSLLDSLGWPTDARDISVGTSTMGVFGAVGSYLAGLQQAQDTEDGELLIDGEGLLVFTNRNDRDVSTYAAVFSNDGSDTPYAYVKPVRDKKLLRNIARITDSDGLVHEARDATSVGSFAPRVLARTTQTTTATEPQDY
ncbi:hypothetical protein LCGC14_2650760, partial [marine sediment metagenome]